MGQKLYVGGLPYSVTQEQLQELFAVHGTVESARVIADKYTGQSRGFGFVDMSSPAEAQQAIKALHGSQLSGRTLVVNEARPQEQRSDRSGGGGGNRGGGGAAASGATAGSPPAAGPEAHAVRLWLLCFCMLMSFPPRRWLITEFPCLDTLYLALASSKTTRWSSPGPCTPMVSCNSISPVRLGPVTNDTQLVRCCCGSAAAACASRR